MKSKRKVQDLKLRKLYKKIEVFQKVLSFIFLYSFKNILGLIIQKKRILKFFRVIFRTQIKNYCVISGRSRSVYKNSDQWGVLSNLKLT